MNPAPMQAPPAPDQRRARRVLLVVALLFAAPLLAALGLRAVGWMPERTRNLGNLIDPPVALASAAPASAGGQSLDWTVAERGWNVLAFPEVPCAADCATLFDALHRVWLTQGRHADRVRVLWPARLPAQGQTYPALLEVAITPALAQALPATLRAPGSVVLVDSRGFAALHYPPGFDPSDLRRDLARLLK